jgi:shikimate kinase
VGRLVAERLGRPYLDFDLEIQRREGAPVAQLFAEHGEPWFRDRERALTMELASQSGMVLAPGGGWMANPGCHEALRDRAVIVYLKVRPEEALTRMGAEAAARPLLGRPDPLAELRKLQAAREGIYLQSNHTVSTDMMTLSQVVDRIVVLAGG